jgi:mono/diheme cytochrome c family protein
MNSASDGMTSKRTAADRLRLPLAWLVLLASSGTTAGAQGLSESQLRRFLDEHCVACHGPLVQKRGLRLDRLPPAYGEPDVAATWVKVLEKLSRGEMPPMGEPSPSPADARAVSAGLQQHLHAASLASQRREGRVVLRRLNRTEYETTLRDLLAAPVEVKELLPDDNVAAGFDNVSAALDISPVHLLRYQDAAEKALRAVVPNQPRLAISERRTGRQITQKLRLYQELLGKSAQLQGDTLVLYLRNPDYIPCATAPAPADGRYRVRVRASAVGTHGKPLPMMCVCRVNQYARDDTDVRTVRDVPFGRAAVIEEEFELRERQVIVFAGWSLPSPRQFQSAHKGRELDPDPGLPGLAVQWVEIEGPLGSWPPSGYKRLFGGVPLEPQSVARAQAEKRPVPPQPGKRPDGWWIYDPLVPAPRQPRDDARRLLRSLLPLAFRRPVTNELLDYYVKLAHASLERGAPFLEAMITAYKAALCSPHFLFLNEQFDNSRGDLRTALDDHAVAARLSYFLWSSMPDAQLMELARKKELRKPEVLHVQVERMLDDPKARRFTANFAGQWLDLRNFNATSPDPQLYAEFDDFLFWSMPRETERFFEEVVRADLSLTEFVHSDWTFLNERLAQHYGITGVSGGELRKVKLKKGCHRGGVLTHAAILKVTADGTRTSAVLRGKWVLDRILGQPPAPPPPDIPAIEPDIRGATTIRQQLDMHRNTAACATCHRHIDPPGFALESFDVIGGWRDYYRASRPDHRREVELANYPGRHIYRGPDVELGGQTPGGRSFRNIDDYKDLLLDDKDQLARNLATKLIIYATGAQIQFADREVVEQLVAACRARRYGFRSLIHEVVGSRVFLNK